MALHTDTDIYRDTYDLTNLVTGLVSNMERNFRSDFGAELRKRCMGLVMRTYEVNTSEMEHRPPLLRRMRHEVETVNLSLRLAVDQKQISHGQYARAIALTTSIAKQATGWQRSSESALVAESSRRPGQCAMESGRTAGPQAHRQAQQGNRRQQPQ